MSTKIFNGYRIKETDLNKIQKLNFSMMENLNKKRKRVIFSFIADAMIEYKFHMLMKPKSNFAEYFKETYFFETKSDIAAYELSKKYSGSFFKFFCEVFSSCSSHNLTDNFNENPKIFFKSYGEYTYYLFSYNYKADYYHKNIESYNYWDSTDRPESISPKEWRERKKNWDKIFSYNSSKEMMSYSVISETYELMEDFSILTDCIQDDLQTLKQYYKMFIVEREFKDKLKDEADVAFIKNKIRDGDYLNYVDEFKSKRLTKEHIIDDLFLTKIDRNMF